LRKKRDIVLRNVLVEDYAAEGKSLARQDGKVIFIEKAVPGDVVDLRLSKNKTGRKGIRFISMNIQKTGLNRFASTLVYVVDASGRCCLMKSNWPTNKSRFMIISQGLVR
jgi:tRNA/tmRNA/rRNA uracil-C5-methylase (TrmA/RlmC/RlmD family)